MGHEGVPAGALVLVDGDGRAHPLILVVALDDEPAIGDGLERICFMLDSRAVWRTLMAKISVGPYLTRSAR
jgi:hypothetical protein